MTNATSKLGNLPYFTDLYGAPLDVGQIYIGQPNTDPRQNPVTVYWDVAQTTAAPQPLATLNGLVSRGGTVADVFVPAPYSLLVLDRRGQQVLYLPSTSGELLGSGIGTTTPQIVANVAALRKVNTQTTLRVDTLGYTAAGDGGAGRYYVDLSDTASADNGFSVIVATDGGRIKLMVENAPNVKQGGAFGDGATNDGPAFASTVYTDMVVPPSPQPYRISTNTTVNSNLIFTGGQITVDAGVTLTINGNVRAGSKILFKGAGIVHIVDAVIDVTWFDGVTADAKWNFCKQAFSNSGHHIVRFPQVGAGDAHAINTSMGWAWNCANPLYFDNSTTAGDGDSIITVLTEGPFAASASIAAVFYFGHGTSKVDVVNFPLDLKVYDLTTNRIASVYRVEGGGHHNVAGIQAWGTGNVLWLNPLGTDQVNDFKLGYVYCAGQTDRPIKLEATANASVSITDCEIGFINSDGLASAAGVDCLVHISGTVTGVKIGKVTLRGITSVAGYVDASTATVLVENTASYAPGYLLEIGSILNGSQPALAKALVARDASGGTGPKIGGLKLTGGVNGAVQPAISLDWTDSAEIATGRAMTALVDANCTNTRVDGHVVDNPTAIAVTASPMTWVNNNKYPVDVSIQGGTVTTVVRVRGGTAATVYSGASLNGGEFRIGPGDNIQLSYSAAPSAIYAFPA